MSPGTKRQNLNGHLPHTSHFDDDQSDNQSISDHSGDSHQSPTDTFDDIKSLKRQSRQTSKRKIRATGNATFGATLEALLDTEAPSSLPLSLKPSVARKRNHEILEEKARKVLQVEKKEKEDTARITDVIGGWGGESERALRKVAQRGVVKLFNAVQQAQNDVVNAAQEAQAKRGSGKPRLPAPNVNDKAQKRKSEPGKSSGNIDKDSFFDLIKAGGVIS